jgi:hypothetical protein
MPKVRQRIFLISFLATNILLGSKIKGRIIIPKSPLPASYYNSLGYWTVENGIIPILPFKINPSQEFVIVLSPRARQGKELSLPKRSIVVKLKDVEFSPKVIPIRPKTKVIFKNMDQFTYQLYSPDLKEFNIGKLIPLKAKGFEFKKPGVFKIRCAKFSHIYAYVLVLDGSYFLIPGQNGEYEFKDILPGQYTMKVFQGGEWIWQSTLIVGAKGDLTLNIKLISLGKDSLMPLEF